MAKKKGKKKQGAGAGADESGSTAEQQQASGSSASGSQQGSTSQAQGQAPQQQAPAKTPGPGQPAQQQQPGQGRGQPGPAQQAWGKQPGPGQPAQQQQQQPAQGKGQPGPPQQAQGKQPGPGQPAQQQQQQQPGQGRGQPGPAQQAWGKQPGPGQPAQQQQQQPAQGKGQPGPPQQAQGKQPGPGQPAQQQQQQQPGQGRGQPGPSQQAWGKQPGPGQPAQQQQQQQPGQGRGQPGPPQQAWGRQPGPGQPAQQQQQPPQGRGQPGPPQQAWGKQPAPGQPAQQQQQPPQGRGQPGPPQQAWGKQPAPGQSAQQQQQPPQGRGQPGPPQQAWGKQPAPGQPAQQQQQPPQGRGQPGPPQQAWGKQPAPGQPAQQQQQPPQGRGQPGPPQQAWGKQPAPGQSAQQQQQPPQGRGQPAPPQQAQKPGQPASQQAMGDVSGGFQKLTVSPTHVKAGISASLAQQYLEQIPVRPNPMKGGTKGTPTMVSTNMFQINFGTRFEPTAVHYDVIITPDKPKFLMRAVFEKFQKTYFPNRFPAFDGKKNAYSANDLPFGHYISGDVEVYNVERDTNVSFTVEMNKVANIDLSWITGVKPGMRESVKCQTTIQVLEIILRCGPSLTCVPIGRSLFSSQTRPTMLGGGMCMLAGGYTSVVLGWKPYVNIDVSHKGFPHGQPVLDLMKEICYPRERVDRLNPQDVKYNEREIESFLRGLKVEYEIPGQPRTKRTFVVQGLAPSARENSFEDGSGSKYTVEQYFAEKKNYRIRNPDLPCVWIGPKQKNIHVPAELCRILTAQAKDKPLSGAQTSNMIRVAATNALDRKKKVEDALRFLDLNNYPSVKNEFKFSIDGNFEKVPARVLDPPTLMYSNPTHVRNGVWNFKQFRTAESVGDNKWTILNFTGRNVREDIFRNLEWCFQKTGREVGMNVGKAWTPFESVRPNDARGLQNYFQQKKRDQVEFVIVIVPNIRDLAYGQIKQMTEIRVGIVTQCLRFDTAMHVGDKPMLMRNILQKINSKLNGTNHTLLNNVKPVCMRDPCIFIGADVTHPPPNAMNMPSIAAVAASVDLDGFKYNMQMRLQQPREEMVHDLETVVLLQLKFYQQMTGQIPKHVFYFRDGVSEGQLPQLMHHELSALRRAYSKAFANKKPQVTFLVVQKRHHIRLFPERETGDRNFNVVAGTVVDTHITHPSHYDFYLVAHTSIKGTARPTKYRCICNESNLSEDDMEQLTYYLCHMFARCTRAVSLPAPTYYAHLGGLRAKALIQGVPIKLDKLEDEQRKLYTCVSQTSPMFFV